MQWHQIFLAGLFIVAGVNHFRSPKMYLKIIPNSFPNKNFINQSSGFLEIVAGTLLLFDGTQRIGAFGIMALLIAFFATHIFMIQNKAASMGLPIDRKSVV